MSEFDIFNQMENDSAAYTGDTYMAPDMLDDGGFPSDAGDTHFEDESSANAAAEIVDSVSGADASFVIDSATPVGDYLVMEMLSSQGKESTVYRATGYGEDFVMKVYNRRVNVDNSRLEMLKNINCPYIVQLVDYGYYKERFYEVYRYYENGTIADCGAIDSSMLKSYINQLNEGLYALHNLSETTTLVHGDLKPDNIFLSDDKQSVLIGDFGISVLLDGKDESFGSICGTPEFAPPSYGLVDKSRKNSAYDYGALGLVIYYMATGYSYFAGRNTAEIAEGWSKGIKLPDSMETRIKILLEGLLVMDEEKRFTYKDVRDWYEGSYVKRVEPKKLFVEKKYEQRNLWLGMIDNQNIEVSSIHELTTQLKAHWVLARNKLNDANFYAFIESFDDYKDIVTELKLFRELTDIDFAVFKTIYSLTTDSEIVYKGISFGNAEEFVAVFSNDADNDEKVTLARELVLSGLFSFYLKKMGYSADIVASVEQIINLSDCSDDVKFFIISFLFSKNKTYDSMDSFEQLRARVANMTLAQIEELTNDDRFIAWLYSLGLTDLAISLIRLGDKK